MSDKSVSYYQFDIDKYISIRVLASDLDEAISIFKEHFSPVYYSSVESIYSLKHHGN